MAWISGSRPSTSVSVWWRVWLQRDAVGSRMIMKQATWYTASSSRGDTNAVPWPASCQRESDAEP